MPKITKSPARNAKALATEAVRAKAIAMFLEGHTCSYVAEELGQTLDTVRGWRKRFMPAITDAMRKEWAEHIETNLYRTIIMAQNAMLEQLKVMSDPAWIKRQSAQELATLHGITHDKVVRLLEAATGAQDAADGSSDQ